MKFLLCAIFALLFVVHPIGQNAHGSISVAGSSPVLLANLEVPNSLATSENNEGKEFLDLDGWHLKLTDVALVTASFLTVIATIVLCIATWKIASGADNIARQRAAIDFFLKTEMDAYSSQMWVDFKAAILTLQTFTEYADFIQKNSDDDKKLSQYLNVIEMLGVGVKARVFEEEVCKQYWEGPLRQYLPKTKLFLLDSSNDYCGVKWLASKWKITI